MTNNTTEQHNLALGSIAIESRPGTMEIVLVIGLDGINSPMLGLARTIDRNGDESIVPVSELTKVKQLDVLHCLSDWLIFKCGYFSRHDEAK